MAVVLAAFASKLASTLAGMAKEEVEMLLGVPGEITKLETTLGDLSSILGDAERVRFRDSAVERWVRELKDVMYDADNILDLCVIMEGEQDLSLPRAAPKSAWCCSIPKLSCFRNPVAAYEIGKKLQALNQRLLDIEKRSSRFRFISEAINTSWNYSADNDVRNRSTAPGIIRSDVVGDKIEEDMWKLVDLLIDNTNTGTGSGVAVVAITGMGGIGKTTLARMVFNDNMVTDNFDKKIWLSVNKEANDIAVLQSVLSAAGGNYNGVAADKAMLENALRHAVRQNKFLLVLDDVWSDKVWNALLRVPLNDGASGSRVLVTTRNNGVACGMRAHHIHQVDKLASHDAWSLLKKQVILTESDESEVDELKDVGMKIVERCDGLPLAVKVVGGLLLSKSRIRVAWMDVLNNIGWSIISTSDDLNNAVYVSYSDLPPHLKQCFLYHSLIPKDIEMGQIFTVQMWMAEGLIQNNRITKLPEDLGLEYYEELISRNLLERGNEFRRGHGCTMHDVVRDFAQLVAKDEGLLVKEEESLSSRLGNMKLRYLSISGEATELGGLETQASLRTLLLFKCPMVRLNDYLDNLRCLRVLHISHVNLTEFPESVCHMKHLRYLELRATGISTVPEGIGDLQFLLDISLIGSKNLCEFPKSILKLQNLRSINLSLTGITSIPRGLGKLKDLVHVYGFPTHSDDSEDGWCSLDELGSLPKLKSLYVTGLEKASSASVAARAKLGGKRHLEWLYLVFASRLAVGGVVQGPISKEEQEQIEEVLDSLCPPPSIDNITIDGYFGRLLPQWMRMMSAFECLRWFELSDYACCEQLPIGLGQLRFLDVLKVRRAPSIKRIGHDFIIPSLGTTSTSADLSRASAAFPKLYTCCLEGMLGWREWEWEEQVPAMPALEKLWIGECRLTHLPIGLAYHARALTMLDLRNSDFVCVENLPSLSELFLINNEKLERITNNPSLHTIRLTNCRRLEALEELPSLRNFQWEDRRAAILSEYLRGAQLNKLLIYCSLTLLKLLSLQDSNSEWGKIEHVLQVKAIGVWNDEDKMWIDYTKTPYSFHFQTNNIGETSASIDE